VLSGQNSALAENLPAGQYYVVVTDANGCSATSDVITLTEPDTLTLTVTDKKLFYDAFETSCWDAQDAEVTLSRTGGVSPFSFELDGELVVPNELSQVIGLSGGSHSIQVTDANGCVASVPFEVMSAPQLVISVEQVTDVSCANGDDGSISISVTGGSGTYSYLWSNGATTQNLVAVSVGSFDVTVTDILGCQANLSTAVEVTAPAPLELLIGPTSNCGLDLSVLGGVAPYSYSWSSQDASYSLSDGTSQDLVAAPVGTYSVLVTDANGCTAQQTGSVTNPQCDCDLFPMTMTTSSVSASCFASRDGQVSASVQGGNGAISFLWTSNDGIDSWTTASVSDLPAGVYHLQASDESGCTELKTVLVTQPSEVTIALSSPDLGQGYQISGFGKSDGSISAMIESSGQDTSTFDLLWSTGAINTNSISGLSAGTYSLTVTDNFNCEFSASIELTEPDELQIDVSALDISCFGLVDGAIGCVGDWRRRAVFFLVARRPVARGPNRLG